MKVTKIELKDYLNFKTESSIDLTYPSTHLTKAGKPLDKVCFIGQSGTGKTTILNLIKRFSFEQEINPYTLDQNALTDGNVGVHFTAGDNYSYSKWSKGGKDKPDELQNFEVVYKGENGINSDECKNYVSNHLVKKTGVKLISFPFEEHFRKKNYF